MAGSSVGLVVVAFAAGLAAVTGCSGETPQVSGGDAQDALAQARNALAAVSQDSEVCRAFTKAEIASIVKEDVSDGEGAGPLGSGCRWGLRNSEDRSVMVQVVPRDYWEDGTRQPGGEALSGIGEKAFVGPWLDDQRAGALTEKAAVYVTSPKREMAVALLAHAVKRVPAPAQ